MTSSQPPQPPPGGQPPEHPTHGPAGGGQGVSFDAGRLTVADYAIAGLTALFLILSFFTWYDFGDDFFGIDVRISGWTDGQIKFAFLLFLAATVWALLPAVTHVAVGFPRSLVTVGLAALGFLLTLFAWFDTFDFEFSIFALLGMLTAAAILGFAVLSLLPELRNRPALPGAVSGASQWANRPASGAAETAQPQAYGQAPQQSPYEQPYQQPYQAEQPPPGTPPTSPPPPPGSRGPV